LLFKSVDILPVYAQTIKKESIWRVVYLLDIVYDLQVYFQEVKIVMQDQ